MTMSLSLETQQLIADRMKQAGVATADEMVRVALEALDQMESPVGDMEFDDGTWDAIERAEEEYQRGGGIPVDEAFAQLRKKYAGQ